jgi:ankyrin repeat protein
MLVKSGADANLPMGDGQTAVHVAAVGGNLAVLRVLLQNGGDAQIADKEGETALHKVKSSSFFSFPYWKNDSYLLFSKIAGF